MKGNMGLRLLPLLVLCANGYYVDGSLFSGLQGASLSPASPLSLMGNVAPLSPLDTMTHFTAASPLTPTASSAAPASMAPFLFPQTYPSAYDMSMPYGAQITSPFMRPGPGCMSQFGPQYPPRVMPYMSPGSPFASGCLPQYHGPQGHQGMPFMPPPTSPFMPGFRPQFPGPYSPHVMPCVPPALPIVSDPYSLKGAEVSQISPLLAYSTDDLLASAYLTNQQAVTPYAYV